MAISLSCTIAAGRGRERSASAATQPFDERHGVVRRPHLHVVVEVGVDVAAGVEVPRASTPPSASRAVVVVARHVQLGVAVQAGVREVGRDPIECAGNFPAVSAMTDATWWRSSSERQASVSKLGCRTSTACRSGGRPAPPARTTRAPTSAGRMARRRGSVAVRARQPREERVEAAPRRTRDSAGTARAPARASAPSASTPEAKKLASGASMSPRRFMWVMKRGPFTEKTKSSGVASRQRTQFAGLCSE